MNIKSIISGFGLFGGKYRTGIRGIGSGIVLAIAVLQLIGNCSVAYGTPPRGRLFGVESLPDTPTNEQIEACQVFVVHLAPAKGEALPQENAALSATLKKYSRRSAPDDFSALTGFLESYPNSVWRISLLHNLAFLYYKTGYYQEALDAWGTAWKEGKSSTDPKLRAVVNLAGAEYARMNARLGRYEVLAALLPELRNEKIGGAAGQLLLGAGEGYALMIHHPDRAFRCGPLALASIFDLQHPGRKLDPAIQNFVSTNHGTSLAQIKAVADKAGMKLQLAQRTPGAPLIFPAVVHWKVGHFAALLKESGGRIQGKDPTFADDLSITPKALDEQASGYFLVPAGPLPHGWQPVSTAEAGKVWGRGATTSSDPSRDGPCDSKTGGCSSCSGMAKYNMHAMLVSLNIQDTPISLLEPVGGSLDFTLTYNQRDSPPNETPGCPYFGAQWTCSSYSYIEDDPTDLTSDVCLYVAGGGYYTYTDMGPNVTSTSAVDPTSQSTLIRTSTSSYEIDYSDGSKDIFADANATVGSGRMVFMTQRIDPAGNTTTYSYNGYDQLTTIEGPTGNELRLTYNGWEEVSSVITATGTGSGAAVTGTATFGYGGVDDEGGPELLSITDAVGNTSSFVYGENLSFDPSDTFITAMTTPYGSTNFSYGDYLSDPNLAAEGDSERWLQATDPDGGTQRLEFHENAPNISGTDPANTVPASPPNSCGFSNMYLEYRNSFYWSKMAYMEGVGNYNMAKITHWLHVDDSEECSGIVESVKEPLENRVWYLYPNQFASWQSTNITSEEPAFVARVLDSKNTMPVTQLYQYAYDSIGNRTEAIDPMGRATTYRYDPANNIDLLATYQENPTGQSIDPLGNAADLISTGSYNSQHLPVRTTDAAGQPTTYAYNSQGQMLTKTVIVSGSAQTTTWNYNSAGFLTSEIGPITSASTTYTYDSANRVETTTDSLGRTLTYGYDALNRQTSITYPDSTMEQTIYDRLDVAWTKDRLNRWTTMLHDSLGRLVYAIDPDGNTTQFQYCPCGALTAIIDANNNQTSFMYDIQSRLTNKVYADGSAYTYAYEPDSSRLQLVTDPKKQQTLYTYNPDNTVAAVAYTGTVSTPSVSYTYDPIYNRVATMSDGVTGTTTYTYNPVPVTPTLGANMVGSIVNTGSEGYALSYHYDELGRVVSRVLDGGTTSTMYDALGRVTQVSNLLGTFGYVPYQSTNMIDHINYPNGQVVQYTYYPTSADERLETITNTGLGTSGTISQFGYGYNAAGDITSWTQLTGTNTTAYQYGYDGADRLLSAAATVNGVQSTIDAYGYWYDAAGNRMVEQSGSAVTTSTYNNLNQLVAQTGTGNGLLMISGSLNKPGTVTVSGSTYRTGTNNVFGALARVTTGSNNVQISATNLNGYGATYSLPVNVSAGTTRSGFQYDANGNLTYDGTWNYVLDSANRLVKIWYGTVGSAASTTMTYDGLGRRVQIVETSSSGTITSTKDLVWEGMTIAEEKNTSGTVTKRYFVNGVQISGTDYYYTRDHLGSIREMTTGTNASIQAQYSYDPYGRQTQLSGTMSADFGFTGDYFHAPSQLCLTLHRPYSPNFARWLSRDPMDHAELREGPNLYDYAFNRPISVTDVMGLSGFSVTGTVINDWYGKALQAIGIDHVDIAYNGAVIYVGKGGGAERFAQKYAPGTYKEWPLTKSTSGKLKYGNTKVCCQNATDQQIIECLQKRTPTGSNCQGDVMDALSDCCLSGYSSIVGWFSE